MCKLRESAAANLDTRVGTSGYSRRRPIFKNITPAGRILGNTGNPARASLLSSI